MMHRGCHGSFSESELVERITTNARRDGDCLLWAGAHNGDGSPRINWRGRNHRAQRLLYKLLHDGAIWKGYCITTRCGSPTCVNPAHLMQSSRSTLNRRDVATGARLVGRSHGLNVALGRAATARLGVDKAHEVALLRVEGWTLARIGERYGVTTAAVGHAITCWKRLGII